MGGTQRLTDETATAHLDVLEQRFGGSPAEILQIPERSHVIEACVAFAALAAQHAPRRFIGLRPTVVERAEVAYERLRQALQDFVDKSGKRPTLQSPLVAPTLRRMINRREFRVMYQPIAVSYTHLRAHETD